MYFYEVIQIKLKVQEVARYAAWEFTGYPLHNYDDGDNAQLFSTAKSAITADIDERYTDLKSATDGPGNAWLMVGWDPPRVRLKNGTEPKIPGGSLVNTIFNVLGFVIDAARVRALETENPVYAAMMIGYKVEETQVYGAGYSIFNPPKKWNFNTKGYIKAEVTLRWRNLMMPKYFMDGNSTGWYKGQKHFSGTKTRFEHRGAETAALVADSWRLDQGKDVLEKNSGKSTAFFKQVDRMAFVSPGVRNALQWVGTAMMICTGALAIGATQAPLSMDPTETTLVSKNYKDKDPDSGKITLSEDKGDQTYDTAPMPPDSEYEKTLKARGPNFMGC
jgi:hypothetical protein